MWWKPEPVCDYTIEDSDTLLSFELGHLMDISLIKKGDTFELIYTNHTEIRASVFGDDYSKMCAFLEGLKVELLPYTHIPHNNQDLPVGIEFRDDMLFIENDWIIDINNRYKSGVPTYTGNDSNGVDDPRVVSLNHFLVDMFPELKKSFEDYVGDAGYFYNNYKTYSNILIPFIVSELKKDDEDQTMGFDTNILGRFHDLLEDLSYSDDSYISNFFKHCLLETIYSFDDDIKQKLFPLRENVSKQHK